MLKRISTFWIILVSLLVTSAIPLGLMALNAIRSTSTGVEKEQLVQLTARVEAHASAIDERFHAFENATMLAAAQARGLLLDPEEQLSPAVQATILSKYQRDASGVYGLDEWYSTVYLPQYGDNRVSDVYLNKNTPLTPELERAIAVTEKLNPIFAAITDSGIGTQWVYLTTPDGMIRLYPWAGNSSYGPDWEPQTQTFYTVADHIHNVDKKPVWTAPYNDCAGAGLMVTSSYPIYDGDKLIAVMSHDLTIKDLQREILGFKVGENGFAFLLDDQGNIIAHKDYAAEEIPLCDVLSIKLADKDPAMAPLVAAMLSAGEGTRYVADKPGQEWVAVFTRIPTTNWHLGLMQPRSEIIQPALNIARQVGFGAIGLVVLAIGVSVVLARGISRPIIQLSNVAREIESSVDAMEAAVGTDQGLAASGVDLSPIRGTREVSNLVLVFREMVTALQKRINELSSVYGIGQTITSTIDYEQTLKTLLAAVQRVVEFDTAEIAVLQGDKFSVEAWSGQEGRKNTTGEQYPFAQGLPGRIAESKTALLISAVSAEGLEEEFGSTVDPQSLAGTGSFLGVPLLIGKRLLGILTLTHGQPGHFTEDDRRQLSRLAAQASIAMENAIQVRQRENALRAQIRELQIEIDEAKKTRQVEEIVESEYFQKLRDQAQRIRNRSQRQD